MGNEVEALPALKGPIKADGELYFSPFPAATADEFGELLASMGYVQEEFFVSGAADVVGYEREVILADFPYTTRILVRRPSDPSRFSGRVYLEPLHAVQEVAGAFSYHAMFARRGDIFVGVTTTGGVELPPMVVQQMPESERTAAAPTSGLRVLKSHGPNRYASLSLYEPSDPGERFFSGLVRESGPRLPKHGGEWTQTVFASMMPQAPGIVSQVGALLKAGGTKGLLAGRAMDRVYAVGYSQTGIFWAAFLDGGYHDKAHTSSGTPIFSGYLVGVSVEPEYKPRDAVVVAMPSEAEARVWPEPASVDTDEPKFRGYEVPGAAHAGLSDRPVDMTTSCASRHVRVPTYLLAAAALENMDRWVVTGEPMPRATRIVRDPSGDPYPLALDEHGNARGGVPNPWIDVPKATIRIGCDCRVHMTSALLFDDDTFTRLYGSQAAYAKTFNARLDELVEQRWLLPEDAEAVRAEAD